MMVVNAGSECYVNIPAFLDQSGLAYVPTQVRYKIDDLSNAAVILPWTIIPPGSSEVITIPAALNAMQSVAKLVEIRQVTIETTPPGATTRYDNIAYNLLRV